MTVNPDQLRKHLLHISLGALAGWLIMILLFGACMWVLSFSGSESPELGRWGFFYVFAMVLTVYFLADFFLLAVPCYFILLRFPELKTRTWMLCGAGLFAASVPVWQIISSSLKLDDTLFFGALACIGGLATFYFFSPAFDRTLAARFIEE